MRALIAASAAVAIVGISAVGGGIKLFGEYDDSPGAMLIGLVLILGAMTAGVMNALRRP